MTIFRDVRHGLRSLTRTPTLTLMAVLTLGLGIGATTTMFSAVHAVLLSPLPLHEPESLVRVFATHPEEGIERAGLSGADFVDLREQLHTLSFVGSYQYFGLALTESERPRELSTVLVTPGMLAELGRPLHGRTFLPEEAEPGSHRVVVLGYGFWRTELGGRADVVGETLSLDGESYRVVGIMPASFAFPASGVAIWAPHALDPSELDRRHHWWSVVARLEKGVTLEQAQAEAVTAARRLEQAFPETNAGWSVTLVPLQEHVIGAARPALLTLLGAVGVVLLIACANVVSLMLAKGMVRRREVSMKAALGATRWTLVRGLLVESLLLAVGGGVVGLGVAWLGVDALVRLAPEGLPRLDEIGLDVPVLGFALLVTMMTGLVFGLAPAFKLTHVSLSSAVSASSRSVSGALGNHRWRRFLSVAQLALSLVLLAGAGSMLRSFLNLIAVDPGFRAENRLAVQLFVYGDKYPTPESHRVFFAELFDELRATPGVRSVAGINTLPLSPIAGGSFEVRILGRPEPEKAQAGYRIATPGLFRTLGGSLRAGRAFADSDRAGSPPVALVNEAAAEHYFPGASPLGQRVILDDREPAEIVGVTGDIRYQGLDQAPLPEIIVPFAQATSGTMSVVVETAMDPDLLMDSVQQAVWRVDPAQPIWRAVTFDTLVQEDTAQSSFYGLLVGLFAGAALLLAAVGLYGVLSFSVLQRRQEIGVRMAMGASTTSILTLFLRDGSTLIAAGVSMGALAAVLLGELLGRVWRPMLFEVSATDAATLAVVALVLSVVGFAACFVPAHRAARLAPVAALRED